ncbi:ABC transporter ATP-binding protein [Candidatus Peregrinibacteria bacterium]|nr:ABC transporter ATP-binding protein [Candidatus Peregrinibacteria bacterium]
MEDCVLSCTDVRKSFEQYAVPIQFLQDHVIRWKVHRKKWHHDALRGVSVSLKRGEWLGIMGHNGSGKTTLLRILAGLMSPDSGTVHRNGHMSCFFELGVGFHPERCAEENIHMHGVLQGLSNREIRDMMPAILEFADIDSHREVPIKCFSVGMRMRLGFAAAAFLESDIYLIDEVFAVGDASFQKKCIDRLNAMKSQGKSAILVGQFPEALSKMCDRLITLENGLITKEAVCPPRPQQLAVASV